MEPSHLPDTRPYPLYVDLDGTLVRTDLLVEALFALLKQNPLYLFLLPAWLLKGKAFLKHQIARRVDLDPGLLPYNEAFLDHLRQERAGGRQLILATASNQKFAKAVARHLGIFDDVLASDARTNLSGDRKLARISDTSGNGVFGYAANGRIDLAIWKRAREAILVNPETGVRGAAERQGNVTQVFEDPREGALGRYIKALRLHQWLKNALIFVPVVVGHRLGDPLLLGQATLAFLSFGLCASSVYLLNDLLDLPADRQHPTKRRRPFAAGSISIIGGTALIPGLLLAAFGLALWLPFEFAAVLCVYYVTTLAYSLRLKRVVLIDVLVLAGLYTIRIIAGAAATSIVPSFWLLAFSMFLFLSLALVKRYTELVDLHAAGGERAAGRGYRAVDIETLAQLGSASAYISILVLALYIDSEAVNELYKHPQFIWLLCPLFLYLLSRIWLLARRRELHEDPVIFVIQDRQSHWIALLGAILLWIAV